MFKVGDRVRCVRVSYRHYSHFPALGREYTVTLIKEDGWFRLRPDKSLLDMDVDYEDAFLMKDFELEKGKGLGNCNKFKDSVI